MDPEFVIFKSNTYMAAVRASWFRTAWPDHAEDVFAGQPLHPDNESTRVYRLPTKEEVRLVRLGVIPLDG